MKKPLLTTTLVLSVLLTSFTAASAQEASVSSRPRAVSHKRAFSQKTSALPNAQSPDQDAVQWHCEQNKAFWLSGNSSTDPALTLYWSGRNYILPRVPTTTGAERFRDSGSGLDLVILPFKAMLFNNRGNRARLVDECKTLKMAVADANPASMPRLFSETPMSAGMTKRLAPASSFGAALAPEKRRPVRPFASPYAPTAP